MPDYRSVMRIASVFLLLLSLTSPAEAQDRGRSNNPGTGSEQTELEPLPMVRLGEVAQSAAGQAGKRQTREQVAAQIGIAAMARVNSRIQNRVQARIRNRIDQYYDPRANAATPFAVASEQANAAGQRRR